MARINSIPRKINTIIPKAPRKKRLRSLWRKLNKLNFLLILGLYAIELDLFSEKTVTIMKSYTKISVEYIVNLF